MKCKACGGTGTSNTCVNGTFKPCTFCDGTGEYEPFDLDVELDKLYPTEQTNEEWFCSLSTEEKAKVLRRKTYGNSEDNEAIEQGWVRWLQAKHEDNPPDIPSVPSWDKWLEGEKTKCEYCDGNGVECDLYGRSECPKTPKTEQEYIQTCNTEQLAEFLCDVWYGIDEVINIMSEDGEISKKDAMKLWLKQPHAIKE